MVDTGRYNVDQEQYQKLVDDLYTKYPSISLTAEYAYFFQENLLQMLIRLARYKFVARLVKKTDHILEIGSGSGIGSMFLSQHCAHVTGIDVKTTEVEEAQSINRRDNVEFRVGDFFQLNNKEQYDIVVALDVIEHMPIEQGHSFMANMARHVKSSGMAIIGTPSIYSYKYQSPLSKASHVKCYDQQELLEMVECHFGRTLAFSMNDEVVHTGFPQMAWYYFALALLPKLTISC